MWDFRNQGSRLAGSCRVSVGRGAQSGWVDVRVRPHELGRALPTGLREEDARSRMTWKVEVTSLRRSILLMRELANIGVVLRDNRPMNRAKTEALKGMEGGPSIPSLGTGGAGLETDRCGRGPGSHPRGSKPLGRPSPAAAQAPGRTLQTQRRPTGLTPRTVKPGAFGLRVQRRDLD